MIEGWSLLKGQKATRPRSNSSSRRYASCHTDIHLHSLLSHPSSRRCAPRLYANIFLPRFARNPQSEGATAINISSVDYKDLPTESLEQFMESKRNFGFSQKSRR